MTDKNYCMSAFLSFRYVPNVEKQFGDDITHYEGYSPIPEDDLHPVTTSEDIDEYIRKQLDDIDLGKAAILLSGGIDSGILASYMPKGTVAYTANAPTPSAKGEIERAKKVCERQGLIHRTVEVTWEDYQECIDLLMKHDGCPVFANEPQVYTLAKKIKEDGFDTIIFGDSADMVFGGYDGLLSRDWTFDEWVKRFTFLDPARVLKDPSDVSDVYERYRTGEDTIDYPKFMDEVFATSSSGAYINSFDVLGMKRLDPYVTMKMTEPIDLERVRSGDSKYLLRELYRSKYPEFDVPEKIAMARAADVWLADWKGPEREEFIPGCVESLTGEQKFLVYSLERFLNIMNL